MALLPGLLYPAMLHSWSAIPSPAFMPCTHLADLLKLMRQQVLQQLSRHLQSELQVLTALSDCNTRRDPALSLQGWT